MNQKPKTAMFELRCKVVKAFLATKGFVTKAEIATQLEWQWPKHDRQIRDILSHIAKTNPIISTSSTSDGYKLAQTLADLGDVKHAMAEINSRIEELEKRKQSLKSFVDNVTN